MMKKLILAALLISAFTVQGQNTIEQGDKLYAKLAFTKALKYYMAGDQSNGEVMLKIAETYKRLQNYSEASAWFAKAYEFHKDDHVAILHYAEVVKMNGDYEKARGLYTEVLQLDQDNVLALNGLASCEEADFLNQSIELYEIEAVAFNSAQYEFAPTYYEDGIVFSSDRDYPGQRLQRFSGTGNHYIDLYYVAEGAGQKPKLMKGALNSKYNDGPLCFNVGETEMFFTKNHKKPSANGILNLKIMRCRWDALNSKWGKPEELLFNNPEYSVAQPAISKNGRTLYFSSDMPGGVGGTDIWYCERGKDGSWSKPKNMGTQINTLGEEKFPYVSPSGELYFASSGHPGLGGLDIFRAEKDEEGHYHVWNLGAPLNSAKDDLSLIIRGEEGYYTSARNGGAGFDDIYKLKAIGNFMEVQVIARATGKPIPGARVELKDGTRTIVRFVDESGHLHLPVANNANYGISASADKFFPENLQVSTIGMKPGTSFKQVIYLDGDYGLTLSGLVLEEKSGLPLESSTVIVDNQKTNVADTLQTAGDGLFDFLLAPDVTYTVTASKEGYQPAAETFNTNGLFEADTIKKTLVLGAGARVYSVAFYNIYFDYNKATLRETSIEELDKMVEILERSEKLRVEISAHTDCRGSDAYNLKLSDQRAEIVVDYLVDKGISADRLMSKGYGEGRLKNHCRDGVKCSEKQHQQNRRVEFSVLDENNEVIIRGED